jgi:hypothetical protein
VSKFAGISILSPLIGYLVRQLAGPKTYANSRKLSKLSILNIVDRKVKLNSKSEFFSQKRPLLRKSIL